MIEDDDQVFALNGSGIELLIDDVFQWTKSYEEDSSFKIVYLNLFQGNKAQKFYLTPT